MNTIIGDTSNLVVAIDAYREALRAQKACSDAWESGDPCAMAENDPSDQYIIDSECDAKRDMVILEARKLAPWVEHGSFLPDADIRFVLREFSWCLDDYNNTKDDLDACASCGMTAAEQESEQESLTKKVAHDLEYLTTAVEKIAGAPLV